MKKQKKIAPSILSADFAHLGAAIKMVEKGGAGIIHVDVMDGHFVPNITIGAVVVKSIRKETDLPLDVHLMIENPGNYIEDFAKAGADYLTVHLEACPHLHKDIQAIKSLGMKAGVSLNPHTPLHSLDAIIADLDLILIMSVNPGFGGQSFIPNTLDKLRRLKIMLKERNLEHIEIEVDGGVKENNIVEIAQAGADLLVAGSAIYAAENPTKATELLVEKLANSETEQC